MTAMGFFVLCLADVGIRIVIALVGWAFHP